MKRDGDFIYEQVRCRSVGLTRRREDSRGDEPGRFLEATKLRSPAVILVSVMVVKMGRPPREGIACGLFYCEPVEFIAFTNHIIIFSS